MFNLKIKRKDNLIFYLAMAIALLNQKIDYYLIFLC